MTAEDVKWSLDRARNPENGIWNGLIGSIDSVEIADPQHHRAEAQEPGSDHHPGARRVQHRDHAQGAVRGGAGRDRCREGGVLRPAPDRHRPVRVRELGARHAHAHRAQPAPLGDGRGRRAAALSRFGDLRDHPGRRDPDPEAEVGRARRRRVHPVRPGRRARRRSEHRHAALSVDPRHLSDHERAAGAERRHAQSAVRCEGAPGAQPRDRQGRDHPDRHLRRRHQVAVLHVLDHADGQARGAALPLRSGEGQGAARRDRMGRRLRGQHLCARRQRR